MAVGENVSAPSVRAGDRAALQAVNLFMADMQAGIGPFLGVLLLGRGWATGAIGAVTTVGGIAGLFTVAASGLILLSQHVWWSSRRRLPPRSPARRSGPR